MLWFVHQSLLHHGKGHSVWSHRSCFHRDPQVLIGGALLLLVQLGSRGTTAAVSTATAVCPATAAAVTADQQ